MIVTIMSHGKKFKREDSLVLDSTLWANSTRWNCESENDILGNITSYFTYLFSFHHFFNSSWSWQKKGGQT